MIQEIALEHLDDLEKLENKSFIKDKLSRRNFRYLLTKANAITLADIVNSVIRGYSIILFNTGTSLARLYSFAVDPDFRNQGIGNQLLGASEKTARDHDCISMRLEVRGDNDNAIRFYKKNGYKQIGIIEDYYEDHMNAIRFEKLLAPHLKLEMVNVPYYWQTLDFTCGPSVLMMAMKALDPSIEINRQMELRIWRESTTIFMTSGYGGCGPYGLALSAYRRGFDVEVYVNESSAFFIDSVRSPEKKEVIQLVQEDFLEELRRLPIELKYKTLSVSEIQEKFDSGCIPIVLISSYRIYHEKFPHWVVVTGFDEKYIYVHDPFVDVDVYKTETDCINMPILKKDFERMAKYGKSGQKSVIIVKKKKEDVRS
ncbi:MAG: peptidase C39 family protein [Candidatus Brocadiaceae bacterium]|nr:peptidase C39 family protein [Candidatus Brocadiaceae bacterium]